MSRYTTEWYASDPRIEPILANIGTSGRVLDFGAFSTATAQTLAARFPAAEFVVVDDTIQADRSFPRIDVIAKRMTPAGITKLGRFDATLALSVLHHLTHWRQYLTALQKSAPILFVETAHPDEDLPKAKAHRHTADMIAHIETIGRPIRYTPGYDPRYQRTLWLVQSS